MIQLNPNEVEERDNLIVKFRTNPLTKPKAKELKRMPEKEKQQCYRIGDIAPLFGIGLLLGMVIYYPSDNESFWKKSLKSEVVPFKVL